MNKIYNSLFLICISIVLLFIQSCNNIDNTSVQHSEVYEKYKVIGEKHNESLDSTYASLLKQKINTSSKKQCADQFEKALNNSLVKLGYSDPLCEKTTQHTFHSTLSIGMQKSASIVVSDSIFEYLELSLDLKKVITTLIEVCDNTDWSVEEFNMYVDNLDKTAVNTLDKGELEIYFSASSVARSFFEYWKINLNKWVSLITSKKCDSTIPTNIRFKTSSVESPYNSPLLKGLTGADVGGAVAGAITGTVTGPGVPACALAGSAGASTAKFIENAWNCIFH